MQQEKDREKNNGDRTYLKENEGKQKGSFIYPSQVKEIQKDKGYIQYCKENYCIQKINSEDTFKEKEIKRVS